MHGNLAEWCRDLFGYYSLPVAPDTVMQARFAVSKAEANARETSLPDDDGLGVA